MHANSLRNYGDVLNVEISIVVVLIILCRSLRNSGGIGDGHLYLIFRLLRGLKKEKKKKKAGGIRVNVA